MSTTVPCREKFQFDLSTYPPGIYIIKLLYNNEICVKKLIKE
ncbi:MAG: T9SS type A sorting domain-containing protein [Bacteroidia bacterium]|nr:T9SS type A sorting domain-containing protein [Bacteroidia bacterium]